MKKSWIPHFSGKKGEVKLYVNNVGKVLDTVQSTEPKAGNDVYLSLDANLQKAAYNILEQELAGILLSKIQNTLDFDRNSVSDGSDVMFQLAMFITHSLLMML